MTANARDSSADILFGADERASPQRSVLLLRWLVIIATSYLVLFSGNVPNATATGMLLVAFILSNLLLALCPPEWFFRTATLTAIVLLDSSIVSLTLLLSPSIEGDVFILYFFVILLAAAGGSFTGIVVAAIFVPALYLLAIGATQGWGRMLRTEALLRVPFLFCVCIFYGFLSERARRERQRAETAELGAVAKTQLFSTLTHDVRNGLGTIVGFAEILLDDDAETLSPRVREILQQIKATSLQSAQLISNLLDAARIEGGQLRILPAPVRVGDLLEQVAERYEAQASLQRIRLEVTVAPDLPSIDADELQLDRVFANLLANALKFTPEGGRILVRAAAHSRGVQVEIEDSGPGIPREQREDVFKMYQQTERGRRAGGAGLGLFIVRTVLEAHRASIEIDDAKPHGCIFRVVLPAATSAAA